MTHKSVKYMSKSLTYFKKEMWQYTYIFDIQLILNKYLLNVGEFERLKSNFSGSNANLKSF